MFGGYTEVAAYYVNTPWPDTGVERDEGEDSLPVDYTPHFLPPDPWHRHSACQRDFIMIAEFSEQEGPKPLITIPREGGGAFDLNEFSVRIMSVDFQNVAGSTFSMNEDTQVIMSETQYGVYAYVYHFILYDYQARGFVRPFCMSYVTPDHNKLLLSFEQMNEEFRRVAQCFKHGNLGLFVKDMTHYLSDLHYTKERFVEREESLYELTEDDRHDNALVLGNVEEEAILRTVTLTGLDNLITEVKVILESTSDMLTERMNQESPSAEFDQQEAALDEDNSVDADNFRYSCSLHSNSPHSAPHWGSCRDRALSAPPPLCNWTEDKDVYKPTVVQTNKKRFEKSLRSIHELCMWGAKEGINRLRSLHKYFSRDVYALEVEESDVSCLEPIHGLLTIGRTVQLNFLSGIDMGRWAADDDNITETSTTLERKWFSSDTVASFHSTDSFLSCEDSQSLTGGQQESPQSLTRGQQEPQMVLANSFIVEPPASRVTEPSTISSSQLPVAPPSESVQHQAMPLLPPGMSVLPSSESVLTSRLLTSPIDIEKCSYDSNVSASGSLGSTASTTNIRESSIDNTSMLLPPEGYSQPIRVAVVSSADHVTNFSQSSPGYGLQKLTLQYSGLCHVMYCLLSGRPTIVFATFRVEREIRAVVQALSLFVPGHTSSSSAVVPYHNKPLCFSDLCRYKLIGLARPEKRKLEHMVPSSVKKYVTILDIEKKMLWAPEYQGSVLVDLFQKRKVFTNEQTYISYIHSVFHDLAIKSCIFFHKFCLGSEHAVPTTTHSQEDQLFPPGHSQYNKTCTDVLNALHIHGDDAHIIQYLADVIKQQHIDACSSYFPEPGCTASSMTLTYRKCVWMKT